MTAADEARRTLAAEEAAAWQAYLQAVRGRSGQEYGDLEPWAWAQLRHRLRSIRARRGWLSRAAAA